MIVGCRILVIPQPVAENPAARRVTDWLGPANVIGVVSLGVGAAQERPLVGLVRDHTIAHTIAAPPPGPLPWGSTSPR